MMPRVYNKHESSCREKLMELAGRMASLPRPGGKAALAEALGVSPSHFSKVVAGKAYLNIDRLNEFIARAEVSRVFSSEEMEQLKELQEHYLSMGHKPQPKLWAPEGPLWAPEGHMQKLRQCLSADLLSLLVIAEPEDVERLVSLYRGLIDTEKLLKEFGQLSREIADRHH